MTMAAGVCRDLRGRFCDRCCWFLPCLSNPARRSALCLKFTYVLLHLIYVAFPFLVDRDLTRTAETHPWYTALYLLLFVATLVQYFLTVGSSPGYVVDAMRALRERESLSRAASSTSKLPSASINVDRNQLGRSLLGGDASWRMLVMELYPRGSSFRQWTCHYCSVLQPPRTKHCHDCDKCVLQFDHHCAWLGTCIGQGNHCRFWWYICVETALCLWTGFLYVTYLKANISRSWWIDAIMIVMLAFLSVSVIFLVLLLLFQSYLVLTNQTTYEVVRRRRIAYMRWIPERVYPFSEGICRNLYNFCYVQGNTYRLERLPTVQELEAKATPYNCHYFLCCRCC